jgi:FkbM family methyltransferase
MNCWRSIDFAALELDGSAQLLLNPMDGGFSRQFRVYGFREPLNTFAIYKVVAKKHPVVLDVGGNIGYFPLVELEAGAEQVVAVEPVASTFSFLSRSLEGKNKAHLLNLAISTHAGLLKLYVSSHYNVTSSSRTLIDSAGQRVLGEINIKAQSLAAMAKQYPISMVRMDVEGHEYQILSQPVPDQIDTLSVELHIIPPYTADMAAGLLRELYSQNFKATVAINEMEYGYYPLIHHFGLTTAYSVATSLLKTLPQRPLMQTNLAVDEVISQMPSAGQIHLLLER